MAGAGAYYTIKIFPHFHCWVRTEKGSFVLPRLVQTSIQNLLKFISLGFLHSMSLLKGGYQRARASTSGPTSGFIPEHRNLFRYQKPDLFPLFTIEKS